MPLLPVAAIHNQIHPKPEHIFFHVPFVELNSNAKKSWTLLLNHNLITCIYLGTNRQIFYIDKNNTPTFFFSEQEQVPSRFSLIQEISHQSQQTQSIQSRFQPCFVPTLMDLSFPPLGKIPLWRYYSNFISIENADFWYRKLGGWERKSEAGTSRLSEREILCFFSFRLFLFKI